MKEHNIVGQIIALDKERHVFVGFSEDDPGNTFLEFRNDPIRPHRLKLSEEALDALAALASAVADGSLVGTEKTYRVPTTGHEWGIEPPPQSPENSLP